MLFFSTICFGNTIKIGFNIPLTGEIPKVGEESRFAAEMMKDEVNTKGGLDVNGKKYMLEFIYEDNESKAESAVTAALKLIERDQVLAIVGPNSSKQAVPAGQICNDNRTPMISPWSIFESISWIVTPAGRPFIKEKECENIPRL